MTEISKGETLQMPVPPKSSMPHLLQEAEPPSKKSVKTLPIFRRSIMAILVMC